MRPIAIALSLCLIVLIASALLLRYSQPRMQNRISVIALSRSGNQLAAGTPQGVIAIRDRTTIHEDTPLNDLAFSPDERFLAIAARNLTLYDLQHATRHQVRSNNANYGTVAFRPNGTALLTITGPGVIESIALPSGTTNWSVCCSTIYGHVAWTAHGIVSAGHWPRLWDAFTGRLLARLALERQFNTLGPIAVDTRSNILLMGSQDGRVYVWDLATRKLITASKPQDGYVEALAVAPSGLIFYAEFGKSLRSWNPTTNSYLTISPAQPTSNLVINDSSLLFGNKNGEVERWSTKTLTRLDTVQMTFPTSGE